MAEGLANHYGTDVLTAVSAGLAPVQAIPLETVSAMSEINVDVSRHVPRLFDPFAAANYDLVINMSGYKLPGPALKELMEWEVRDPYGSSIEAYRVVRDDLELRVMRLILALRRQARTTP
jgi:arsenate reductase